MSDNINNGKQESFGQDGSYGYLDFPITQPAMGGHSAGYDWAGGNFDPASYGNSFAVNSPSTYGNWDMTDLQTDIPNAYGAFNGPGSAGLGFQDPQMQMQPQNSMRSEYNIASPSTTEATANSFEIYEPMTPTPSPASKTPAGNNRIRQASKRRKFGLEDGKKVAEVREIGSCLGCKVLRTRCGTGIPCTRCVKILGNNVFDQHDLCWRQSLMSTRFNATELLRVRLYEHCKEQVKNSSTDRYIGVSSPTCCGDQRSTGTMDFEANFGIHYPQPQPSDCLFKSRQIVPLPHELATNDVPSLEVFYQDFPISGHRGLTGPFGRIHTAVGRFAAKCKNSRCVKFEDYLLYKCLDLNRALNTYHKASTSDSEDIFFDPSSAFDVKHSSAVKAVALEREILRALEQRVFSRQESKKYDLANPLSTWLCIWILLLSYQEHMHLTKYFNRNNIRVSGLHELAKHMFNAVTTIYAVYFRNQNPLAYDWNTAQVQKELGYDFEILECFQNIKTEITTFYLEDAELSEHDVLFKTLVVEQDRKMLAARPSSCAWANPEGIFSF